LPLARLVLWLLSLGSLLYCGLSWREPHASAAASIGLLCALFACSTLGVLWPRFGMFGRALWRAPPGGKRAALTFDDGPNPETTPQVLRILAEHGAHATFFVLGHKLERHPQLARQIHDGGHELAVHGFEHARLFSLRSPRYVASQIERTARAISAACGARVRYFRPPVGFASHRTFRGAERAGIEVVAWTTRALDGIASAKPEQVASRVIAELADGAIVMLHDAAERDDFVPASLAALPQILAAGRERGLRFVPVRELFAAESRSVEPQLAASSNGAPSTKLRW
jgi:peptidoglycan/xylan/chitin deacetylase (PgdA/CDA1 family)